MSAGWLVMETQTPEREWVLTHPQSGLTGRGATRAEAERELRRLLSGVVAPDALGRGRPAVLAV